MGATGRFVWFLAGISLFVLYVSGLLRWLCRSGKVRDRELNFATLRSLLARMRKMIYQAILGLFLLIRWLARKAKQCAPYIIVGIEILLEWVNRIRLRVMNQQKRIGKK